MTQEETDKKYMRRCLQIARGGLLTAKPNPSVGAVIVSEDGRIIGEGFTSAYGGPHAEVNAFASVSAADEGLLPAATMYVSLEPCSHWGHTPPCCDLIIRKGVKRVVVGCIDPFAKVHGRGIQRMREAGIRVDVGVLERACWLSNKRFMTFNTHHRPYILLKWAQSADGFISSEDGPVKISTPFTTMLVHKLRAESDAILVGRRTLETDHPQLNVRQWNGPDPERIVLTTHGKVAGWQSYSSIGDVIQHLYEAGKQSLLVEGGARTLQRFLSSGLWDEVRVETGSSCLGRGIPAPTLPADVVLERTDCWDGNIIRLYSKKE